MVVKIWRCSTDGPQPSKIVGRDGVPRCPLCGLRMERIEYGVEHPPKESRR